MERLKLYESNPHVIFSLVRQTLQAGKLVIVPTDTVYGILGRADHEETVTQLFVTKKRPEEKAFPIFVKSVAEARRFAYIADAKAKFLEKVWPGPITAIFHHKEKLPHALTGGGDTIGIRVPKNSFILELLESVPFPLAQTSANISGSHPAKTLDEILRYFGEIKDAPALFIDGGDMRGTPSTVVDYTRDCPMLLRAGLVSSDELENIFRDLM